VLAQAERGATFLLNSQYPPEEGGSGCRWSCSARSSTSNFKFYVVDGYGVAEAAGCGRRVNTSCRRAFSP